MIHNFSLPQGNSEMDDGERPQAVGINKDNSVKEDERHQQADLEKGISDDEGDEATFERLWPGPIHKQPPRSMNKKSPRCSENVSSQVSSPRTKKPRMLSLFGGPATHSDEDTNGEEAPPKTPGQGIGMKMLSLTLAQQGEHIVDSQYEPKDNEESLFGRRGSIRESVGLSNREDSQAPSERSSKFDDEEYPMQYESAALSYGLRRNINRTVAQATWVDVDQSGNYDPEQEAREEALKLNKAKAKKKNKGMTARVSRRNFCCHCPCFSHQRLRSILVLIPCCR
jgi:hypothetical protein